MRKYRPADHVASPRQIAAMWFMALLLSGAAICAPALWHSAHSATLRHDTDRQDQTFAGQRGWRGFHHEQGRHDMYGCWDRPWYADPRDGYEFC